MPRPCIRPTGIHKVGQYLDVNTGQVRMSAPLKFVLEHTMMGTFGIWARKTGTSELHIGTKHLAHASAHVNRHSGGPVAVAHLHQIK
jgi:hypothetical protein